MSQFDFKAELPPAIINYDPENFDLKEVVDEVLGLKYHIEEYEEYYEKGREIITAHLINEAEFEGHRFKLKQRRLRVFRETTRNRAGASGKT